MDDVQRELRHIANTLHNIRARNTCTSANKLYNLAKTKRYRICIPNYQISGY